MFFCQAMHRNHGSSLKKVNFRKAASRFLYMARSDIEKKRSGFEMGGEGRKNKKTALNLMFRTEL